MIVGKGDVVADGDNRAKDEEKACLVELRTNIYVSIICMLLLAVHQVLTACKRR